MLVDVPLNSALSNVLSQMLIISLSSDVLAQEKLRTLSQLLVLELFDVLTCSTQATNPSPPSSTPQDFIIDQFFARSFHLNDGCQKLAKRLNVTSRQLNRIIKQAYGMNYREKLNETRLRIALDLLCHGDKSISQIAELLGYSSCANFTIFIKKLTGKTPSQLRTESRTFL